MTSELSGKAEEGETGRLTPIISARFLFERSDNDTLPSEATVAIARGEMLTDSLLCRGRLSQ